MSELEKYFSSRDEKYDFNRRLDSFNSLDKLQTLFPQENEVLDLLFFNEVIPKFIDAIDRSQKMMPIYIISRKTFKSTILSDYQNYSRFDKVLQLDHILNKKTKIKKEVREYEKIEIFKPITNEYAPTWFLIIPLMRKYYELVFYSYQYSLLQGEFSNIDKIRERKIIAFDFVNAVNYARKENVKKSLIVDNLLNKGIYVSFNKEFKGEQIPLLIALPEWKDKLLTQVNAWIEQWVDFHYSITIDEIGTNEKYLSNIDKKFWRKAKKKFFKKSKNKKALDMLANNDEDDTSLNYIIDTPAVYECLYMYEQREWDKYQFEKILTIIGLDDFINVKVVSKILQFFDKKIATEKCEKIVRVVDEKYIAF